MVQTSAYLVDMCLSTLSGTFGGDKGLAAGTICPVDAEWFGGFQKRIEWILEHRGMSRRSLSLRAGLSQAHVGMILRGEVGEEVTLRVVHAIADAGRVDRNWLSTGDGDPDLSSEDGGEQRWTALAPRYPNLADALADLSDELLAETVTWAHSTAMHYPEDLERGTWVKILLDMDRKLRRREKTGDPIGRPLPDEDDTPPEGR